MAKGRITLQELADKDVLELAPIILKGLAPLVPGIKKIAQDSKKELEAIKKTALDFNKLNKEVKVSSTRKEMIALGEKEEKLKQQQLRTNQQLQKLEQEKNKTIQTTLRNEKAKLDIEAKKITAQKRSTKLTIEERVQNQALNKVKRQQAREELGLVDAYEKLNNKRTKAQRTLANLLSADKKNVNQIKIAQKEYNKLDARVKQVDASTKNFSKNIGNYRSALGGLSGTFRNLAGALGLVGGIYGFVRVIGNAFKRVREFDKSMQNLAGVFRTTRKEIAPLEKQIIDVSSASIKTSREVADLAEKLATLGKTPEEISKLLKPVVDLGIGLNTTSGEAGEFLVQMLNAFGAGEDEALKYADIIATIRTSTSLDFQRMRDSFQYIAPISKLLNKDLAYTGSVIGILSDNSLKAESAGRLLATAQQKLSKEGLTLNDALEQINKAQEKGVKENALLRIASDLFGKQAAKIGVILANNTDLIEKNAEAIRGNSGALEDLTNQQLESLDAKLKILDASWEKFILSVEKGDGKLSNFFKGVINELIFTINFFTRLNKTQEDFFNEEKVDRYNGLLNNLSYQVKNLNEESKNKFLNTLLEDSEEKLKGTADEIEEITKKRKRLAEIESTIGGGSSRRKIRELRNEKEILTEIVTSYDQKKELIKEEIKAIKELLKGKDKQSKSTSKEIRDVAFLRTEISKLKKEQTSLTITDIARSKQINAKVKAYQKEIDTILQVNKATKGKNDLEKDAYALNQFYMEQEIKLQQEIADNEENGYYTRLGGIERANLSRKKLLIDQANFEITREGLTADAIKLIQEKLKADILDLEKKSNEKAGKLFLTKIEKLKDFEIKAEKDLQKEINAEKLKFQKGEFKTIEEYDNKIASLKLENSKKILHNQIDYLEAELLVFSGTTKQKILLEQELAKVRQSLNDVNFDDSLDDAKKKEKEYAELVARIEDIRQRFISESAEVLEHALGVNAGVMANFFDVVTKQFDDSTTKIEKWAEIAKASVMVVGEIGNQVFSRNIENIDSEIEKNNEKYDTLIELNEGDAITQENLRKQKAIDEEKLNKKKRKEQEKQAKFNQATAVAEIALNTARTVMAISSTGGGTYFADFGISAATLTGIYLSLGAAQLASVLATPLPKYAKGIESTPRSEKALVGEVRPEVITEKGKDPYIVSKPTILDLPQGTRVDKSLEDYNQRIARSTNIASLTISQGKLNKYEAEKSFADAYLLELIRETKANTKAVKGNRTIVNTQKSPDINQAVYSLNNRNWHI